MNILSRVSIAFVFCLTFFALSFVKPVLAQTNATPLSNFSTTNVNPDVPQNIHSMTQIVTTEVLSTMICQLSGIDVMNSNQSCLGVDPQTHRIGFAQTKGGLIGLTMNGISAEFQLPIHSSDYIRYMANKFEIAGHAYAANPAPAGGMGFTGLLPLIGLWSAFRNIVYLFFVIIFVLVGIAIMLRVQIDPRTVMTLENQLPKIVIGLILVTFSYAIAGVLVDAMWLVTFLVVNVVAGTDVQSANSGAQLTKEATANLLQGPLGYVNHVFDHNFNGMGGVLDVTGVAIKAIHDVVSNIITVNNNQNLLGQNINTGVSWTDIFTNISNALLTIIGAVVGSILGLLGGLIILVALFITMFRVWFALLQAYAYIILDAIMAPFHIAAGLVPGSTIGFGSWLRGIAANLLMFPTVVFMFVLARVLLDAFSATTTVGYNSGAVQQAYAATTVGGGSLFEPPLIGSFNGGGTGNPLGAFVALAIIFATPSVMGVVKKSLQVEDSGLGAAAMAGIGSGTNLPGRATAGLWSMASTPAGVKYEKGAHGEAKMMYENGALHRIRNFVGGFRSK